jgi:hypothetical protein
MAISFSKTKFDDVRFQILDSPLHVLVSPVSSIPIAPASCVQFLAADQTLRYAMVETVVMDKAILNLLLFAEPAALGIDSAPHELLQTRERCPIPLSAVTQVIFVNHSLERTPTTHFFFERFFDHQTRTVHGLAQWKPAFRMSWVAARAGVRYDANYNSAVSELTTEIQQFLKNRFEL